jgi:hypothetical protein
MVPFPVPALVIVRFAVVGDVELELKVAVQVISVLMVKAEPQLVPDHPAKIELLFATVVKLMLVPGE